MSRPTAVVTGASSGLGLAVAEQLAASHRVVLLARDPARGEAARQAVSDDAVLVGGDLSDSASTRAAASALLAATDSIDVLVHNAGLWPHRRVLNADGVEQAFATNHLAPFLLNHLLEQRLRDTAARVVQVSAGIYVKGRVDLDRTPTGDDFSAMRTYADTKACNLTLLPLWAERWAGSGITVNAVHPGVVRTNLGARPGPMGLVLKLVKRGWLPPEKGARPVVELAVDRAWEARSGVYYEVADGVGREVAPTGAAGSRATAEALWTQALTLTGLLAPA